MENTLEYPSQLYPIQWSGAETIRLDRSADKPPKVGETTGNQIPQSGGSNALTGFGVGNGVKGFDPPPDGTFDVYRKIASHPTVAVALAKIASPIFATPPTWMPKGGAKPGQKQVKDKYCDFCSSVFDHQFSHFVRDGLRAVAFGFAPFEKVWGERDGKLIVEKLKPLRVDNTTFLYDKSGQIVALRNKNGGGTDDLAPNKYFSWKLGSEDGDPYGRSRLENIRAVWSDAAQVLERFAKYLAKVAAIIGQIHYPDGTSKNASGADYPNFWLAQQLAADAQAGKFLLMPNKFMSFLSTGDVSPAVLEKALQCAGKSDWVLSFVDPGGTDFAPGFIAALEYWDKLLVRGLYQPERSILEGKHGTKADAGQHNEASVDDSQHLYNDMLAAFNRDVVDEMLVLNFGESKRGAAYAEAPPLNDDSQDARKDVLKAGLANPVAGPIIAGKIDWDSVADDLDVPILEDQRGGISEAIAAVQQAKQPTPTQPASVPAPTAKPSNRRSDAAISRLSRWLPLDEVEDSSDADLDRGGSEDGNWVTINGAHVLIGHDGTIKEGPSHLIGKTADEAKTAKRPEADRSSKRSKRSEKGEMHPATKVGSGKDSKIVMADGSETPAHIEPGMIAPAYSHNLQISKDPEADGWARSEDDNGNSKPVYNPRFLQENKDIKWGRVREGMSNADQIRSQIQADRLGPNKNEADAAFLMSEQATRPGSEEDTKGNAALWSHEIKNEDVKVERTVTNAKGVTKTLDTPNVTLRVGDEEVLIRDEGARQEILSRMEAGKPLGDAQYWLKSHGATTLEGRHVIPTEDGGARLQFMGKEGVWHDHEVQNPELAKMLLDRKAAAGDRGSLFGTDYNATSKYVSKLGDGSFSPKDLRTIRANEIASKEVGESGKMVDDEKGKKAFIRSVSTKVSGVLGNRPQEAFNSYIDPRIWDKVKVKS